MFTKLKILSSSNFCPKGVTLVTFVVVFQGWHGYTLRLARLCLPGAVGPGLLLDELLPQRARVGRWALPSPVLCFQHEDGYASGETVFTMVLLLFFTFEGFAACMIFVWCSSLAGEKDCDLSSLLLSGGVVCTKPSWFVLWRVCCRVGGWVLGGG